MTARLLGVLGLVILAALAWVLGVRDILACRRRAGAGKILPGLGLLVWVLLGAFTLERDHFNTPVEWGALLAGGVLILVGAVLGEKRKHDRKANNPSDQAPGGG
jgi:peptidoglycan/LPS O-acetylase OafA/YrhL